MTSFVSPKRRWARAVLAVGATVGVSVAVSPLAPAAPSLSAATADRGAGTTATAAGADVELPANQPVNFTIDDLTGNGDVVVSFLRDALDLASRFLTVDTASGVIKLVDDLLSTLTGGTGGSSDSQTAGGSFDASKLPDFLEQGSNGVISGDTTGVKPGTYKIKGTLTDPSGREVPVELSLSVGEPSDSGSSNSGEGNSNAGNNAGDGSGATTGNSNTGNGSGNSNGTQDTNDNATSADVTYENVNVPAGDTATVKPAGDTAGKIFVSKGNPDWVEVNPTSGVVTLKPTDGTSAGEHIITVGYTSESMDKLIADANSGSVPDLETTTFTASVERSGGKSDATAETVNASTNNAGATNSDSTTGGNSNTSNGTNTDAGTQATTGGAGGANNTVQTNNTADGANQNTGNRQGTKPVYVDTAQSEQLPVTGVNANALGAWAVAALMVGVGALLLGTRRKA